MRRVVLFCLQSVMLIGQVAQLGPPPLAPVGPPLPPGPVRRAPGNWFDTSDRAAIRDAYNNILAPNNSVPMGWTGAIAGCNAGDTSVAWKGAVLQRINYFRGMAGVPMGISLNSTYSSKSQQAALMMSANRALSHDPPPSWLCYSANGDEAAGKSNLCYLFGWGDFDPGCVGGYMDDSGDNNTAVGHRRYMIYPQTTNMGTGDVAQNGIYPRTNSLWVFDDNYWGPRPGTRDNYVAWPPQGYVPYQIVPQRWSFSYPGANFSSANVTVTKGGVDQGAGKLAVENGYGENALVFEFPQGFGNPGSDATYSVTITGVGSAPNSSYAYNVIIFDPATAGGGAVAQTTINTNPQGLTVVVDSAQYTAPAQFTWTSGSQHTIDVVSPQTSGGVRNTFANWSHGGSQQQSLTAGSTNSAYTAHFTTQYLLTTSASPPAGGSVSAGGYFNGGQQASVTATSNAGYQFNNWSGDASGSSNPVNVLMNAPRNVIANFSTITCNYSLSSNSASFGAAGGGGSVNVTTTTGCNWSTTGVPAWITINSGLSGSGSGAVNYTVAANSGAARAATLTIGGQSHTVSQNAAQVTLTFQSSPSGLALQVAGAQYTSPVSLSFNVGAAIQATAITPQSPNASTNYAFASWSDGPTTASRTINVPSSAATYTASFGARHRLTLAVNPAAGGMLTANPASADGFHSEGSQVQLTASPANGYLFSGYSGDLSGVASTQSITMSAPRTVTANFTLPVCNYAVAPSSASFTATGGQGSFQVTAGTGCAWTVAGLPTWITILSGANGSGNGQVNFNVGLNPLAALRTATLTIAGQTFAVTQSAAATPPPPTTGMRFVKLDPCRVMETRGQYNFQGRTGAFGPPFLTTGETRTMLFPASNVCSIPASARAYVLNVTLVPRGPVDYVTIWPGGEAMPEFWTIRSPDGNIVANSAIVKAGAGGAVSVFSAGNADLLLDISGYFTDDSQASNLVYYPLTPCRVVETRSAYRSPEGPFGPPAMAAGQTRAFRFPVTPYCTIPNGAAAYSVTITAVPPGPLQYLTAWPAGGAQPNSSSINSPAGRVLANSVILPAGSDGGISAFVFDRSDVLIDITGYFAPDNGQGLLYFPITQCRAMESTFLGDESQRTLAVPTSSRCPGIPATASAYALNVTAIPGGSPMPFLTVWPSGQARPNVSILNAFDGQTVTNSAIVPAGSGGLIDIFAFRRTNVAVEVAGYFGR